MYVQTEPEVWGGVGGGGVSMVTHPTGPLHITIRSWWKNKKMAASRNPRNLSTLVKSWGSLFIHATILKA